MEKDLLMFFLLSSALCCPAGRGACAVVVVVVVVVLVLVFGMRMYSEQRSTPSSGFPQVFSPSASHVSLYLSSGLEPSSLVLELQRMSERERMASFLERWLALPAPALPRSSILLAALAALRLCCGCWW